METLTWSDGPDFPFSAKNIAYYSTTQTSDAVYVIEGRYSKHVIADSRMMIVMDQ